MKRILTTTAEPEITVNNDVTCVYLDQFENIYLVDYKVIDLDAEKFEDVADWDEYKIYEGGFWGKDVTADFKEAYIKCGNGYEQGFISLNDLTETEHMILNAK